MSVAFAGEAASQVLPEPAPVDTVPEAPYSPRGAFFRSLVLPGWGQAYVGAPGRGAVYFSLTSASVWMTYVARQQQANARAQQDWLRESGVLPATEQTDLYEARAQQFEDWATLSIFLAFFAGADAYVSAYLADFDERIGVTPGDDGSVQLRVHFPLGRGR